MCLGAQHDHNSSDPLVQSLIVMHICLNLSCNSSLDEMHN